MLKNKPNDKWIYKALIDFPPLKKEEMFSTEEKELNPQHFKKVAYYRYAFVGNMQEKLNEVMEKDLMKHYAKTVSCSPRGNYITTKIVNLPALSLKEKLKNWVCSIFNIPDKEKQKEDDLYFNSLFDKDITNHF